MGQVLGRGTESAAESSGGSIGIGLGGLGKAAGLGALAGGGALGAITFLLEQFKPLVAMVRNIGMLLSQFLRPIGEFVLYLLQPIVMMLRPLLVLFNAIFAPYRRAAAQLSANSSRAFAEGDEARGFALAGLSAMTILKPISDMLLEIQEGVLKVAVEGVGSFLKGAVVIVTQALSFLAGIFSEQTSLRISALGGAAVGLIDHQVTAVQMGIDHGFDVLKDSANNSIMKAAKSLGVDVIFPTIAGTNKDSILSYATEGFKAFGLTATEIVNTQFKEEEGFIGAFDFGMQRFGQIASERTKHIFEELNKSLNEAKNIVGDMREFRAAQRQQNNPLTLGSTDHLLQSEVMKDIAQKRIFHDKYASSGMQRLMRDRGIIR